MIINQFELLTAAPIRNMISKKTREHGVSHGLSEVGYDIRIKQEIIFRPYLDTHFIDLKPQIGNFALASAIEEFDMPNNLAAIVHDKSTWARHGLSVFNTVIEPGWKGFLTLELVYHGRKELVIPAGAGIAQVIFHQIAVASQYEGKYQNQQDKPVTAILD